MLIMSLKSLILMMKILKKERNKRSGTTVSQAKKSKLQKVIICFKNITVYERRVGSSR